MNLRFKRTRTIAIRICAAMLLIGVAEYFSAGLTNAQNKPDPSVGNLTNGQPNSKDPFILGPWLPLRAYNSSERLQWAADFVLSPSSAKDRIILYSYDLSELDVNFFVKLEDQIHKSDPKIAVVSSVLSRKLTFFGNDVGYFCVPIILDGQNKEIVGDFIKEVEQKRQNRFLPSVIAVSALKTTGLDLDTMREWNRLAFERPWSGVLATSIPISGPYKPSMYVASRAWWDVSKNPPETFATLSELENRMWKNN